MSTLLLDGILSAAKDEPIRLVVQGKLLVPYHQAILCPDGLLRCAKQLFLWHSTHLGHGVLLLSKRKLNPVVDCAFASLYRHIQVWLGLVELICAIPPNLLYLFLFTERHAEQEQPVVHVIHVDRGILRNGEAPNCICLHLSAICQQWPETQYGRELWGADGERLHQRWGHLTACRAVCLYAPPVRAMRRHDRPLQLLNKCFSQPWARCY